MTQGSEITQEQAAEAFGYFQERYSKHADRMANHPQRSVRALPLAKREHAAAKLAAEDVYSRFGFTVSEAVEAAK